MTRPTDIDEALEQAAITPRKIKDQDLEIENRSIDELHKEKNRQSASTAGGTNKLGLRMVQLIPPGAG